MPTIDRLYRSRRSFPVRLRFGRILSRGIPDGLPRKYRSKPRGCWSPGANCMGHMNSTDLRGPEVRRAPTEHAKNHWWMWVIAAILLAGGLWYCRGAQKTEA